MTRKRNPRLDKIDPASPTEEERRRRMRKTLARIRANPRFVEIKAEDLGIAGLILTYPRSPAKSEEGDPGEQESDDDF